MNWVSYGVQLDVDAQLYGLWLKILEIKGSLELIFSILVLFGVCVVCRCLGFWL